MTSDQPTPRGTTASPDISPDELELASRNHAMPLEAMRADVTPVGLHYLLIHYDIPFVDPQRWRLSVAGHVERPLTLDLDDIKARPARSVAVTLECAGNGRALLSPRAISQPWLYGAVGTGEWTGIPLRDVLAEAGVRDGAVDVVFRGLDRGVEGGEEQRYERALGVGDALRDDVLLVYALNGAPLPPQHGYPLRLLVPGWYGMASVKWLGEIDVVTQPFAGYQHARAYRLRQQADDEGTPLGPIAVRSLMVPPGIPDFGTRRRFVRLGPCELDGRAWSGTGPVERVEVSGDGGRTWFDASVEPAPAPHAWQRWTATWTPAAPGETELCCRATDAAGNVQPLEHGWNLGGYAANAVHRVPVTVLA